MASSACAPGRTVEEEQGRAGPDKENTIPSCLKVNVKDYGCKINEYCGNSSIGLLASKQCPQAKGPFTRPFEVIGEGDLQTLKVTGDASRHGGEDGPYREVVPMSARQERMYFMQMASPDSRAFNLGLCLRFKCKNPCENLPANFHHLVSVAIKALVTQHPNLCVSVLETHSQLTLALKDPDSLELCSVMDIISAGGDQALSNADLETLGSIVHETFLEEQLSTLASKEVDLSKQVFHCALVKVSQSEAAIVFTFHHIVMDGTSLYIVSRDLIKFLTGELLCPYAGYSLTSSQYSSSLSARSGVAWASLKGESEKMKRKLAKWVSLLSTAQKCTSFPKHTTHGPHPHTAHTLYLPIPPTTHTALTHLTHLTQVSSVVVLSSMFTCALARFMSESDIIIGMVSANRGKDSTNSVGYFVNTLPLRVNFSSEGSIKTLTDLLKQVKKNWSLILDGGLDLADLLPHVDCLKHCSETLTAESPLQVLFSYYSVTEKNPLPVEIQVGGVDMTCHTHSPKAGHTHTDLVLEVNPTLCSYSGEQLFTWDYRISALTQQQVESLHQLLCGFIESAYNAFTFGNVAVPPITLVPGTSEQLTDVVLKSELMGPIVINRNSIKPNGSPLCYIERFNKVVADHAGFPAFIFPNGDTLSYSQVNILVTKIALLLFSYGVKPGDHIGVQMSRSPWLYITILSILKCACAYAPIDTNDTRDRGLKVLQLAKVKILVTESHLTEQFEHFEGSIVEVNKTTYSLLLQGLQRADTSTVLSEFSDFNISYTPEQISYILFTSGTTGEPKGVAISERNLHATLDNLQHLFSHEETELSLASASVSFDGHITDALFPLINHSCLVVTDSVLDVSNPEVTLRNPALLKITFAFATPTAASVVTFPKTMRALKVGGEVFSRACFKNTLHIPKVVNGYGPTESTAFVATNHLPRSVNDTSLQDEEISCIGLPVPNVKLVVLDEAQNAVPQGDVGVLHIAGPTVSSVGYYSRPDLTQKAFFPNPNRKTPSILQELSTESCSSDHDILYCTGDLVKVLPNGKLQFLGRADDQVKLRGIRFQLLNVEHSLSQCPHVTTAVAFVKNHGSPSAQLVACVIPLTVDSDGVKDFAAKTLPKYMVPSVVVAFEEFPLTKTGKIDKKQLERLVEARTIGTQGVDILVKDKCTVQETGSPLSMPSLEGVVHCLALRLSEVFAAVLGVSEYDPHNDFFTSGGHSLLMFKLMREVNNELGLTLNLSHMLQNPTPVQLVRFVLSQQIMEAQSKFHGKEVGTQSIDYHRREEMIEHCGAPIVPDNGVDTQPESVLTIGDNCGLNNDNVLHHDEVQEPSSFATECKGQTFDYLSPVPDVAIPDSLKAQLELILQSNSPFEHSIEDAARKLEQASGVQIPASTLMHYTSLSMLQSHFKLKTILSFKNHPNQNSVVILHPQTSKKETPLFFIHAGIIGWALPYYRLAQTMQTYSVAIQYTAEAPKYSFEQMAKYYLQQIQSVQQCGSYKLIGVCYGAILVYEIARQLSDMGKHVQLAMLINNSPYPENIPNVFTSSGEAKQGTPIHPYSFYQASLQLDFSQVNLLQPFDRTGVKCEDFVSHILSAYPWLRFSVQDLIDAYYQYYLPVKAVWSGEYQPKPLNGCSLGSVVLVRNKVHPFFKSHDYGLLQLVDQECLSVIVPSKDLGMLNEQDTLLTVSSIIKLYV